jgi:hypothetical protein
MTPGLKLEKFLDDYERLLQKGRSLLKEFNELEIKATVRLWLMARRGTQLELKTTTGRNLVKPKKEQ